MSLWIRYAFHWKLLFLMHKWPHRPSVYQCVSFYFLLDKSDRHGGFWNTSAGMYIRWIRKDQDPWVQFQDHYSSLCSLNKSDIHGSILKKKYANAFVRISAYIEFFEKKNVQEQQHPFLTVSLRSSHCSLKILRVHVILAVTFFVPHFACTICFTCLYKYNVN